MAPATQLELYPLVMGTHRWWRLQVIGLAYEAFLAALRQAAANTKLTTGLIGAKPKTDGASACGYLNGPGDDSVLDHAMAVSALTGVELTLGEAQVC